MWRKMEGMMERRKIRLESKDDRFFVEGNLIFGRREILVVRVYLVSYYEQGQK
jgi:hypothetical protein